ncbi:MAG: peptide ABC transporter substrate-binding protein [Bacillati bacterium ANGP1]|uniref:Peptide ABC transporter substrate-binding protein n=1 Tax=Candidatus Segetimicrobium genomatis TaxID=2569760 RepID=A0A537JJG1_9BACT|nr:MAG: peptide ABC transporter substrate-binding protein [Terrabacteria group bacterium ANGP1]
MRHYDGNTGRLARAVWLVMAGAALGIGPGSTVGAATVNSAGTSLPGDAAPPSAQVLTLLGREGTYIDWSKTVQKSQWHPGLMSEPLIMQDINAEIKPLAAERWTISPDGRTWTFFLRRGLQWSDGAPLTAEDFEYTLKRIADPQTGFDVAWYFGAIKGFTEANEGKASVDLIGVVTANPTTLQITTTDPTPYLPMLLSDLYVVPKHIVSKVGDTWSTSPATAVSAGPFKLASWERDRMLVYAANPLYRGLRKPYLERIVYKIGRDETLFPAYLGGEIDAIPWIYEGSVSPSDIARIQADPRLKGESYTWPYYQTWWIAFGGEQTAFKDPRVRRAFAMAVDRDAIIKSVWRGMAAPAYGMLPPGFHCADPARLKGAAPFNPEQAKRLLAEAGYPDGKGFPKYDLLLRAASPSVQTAGEAIQAMIKQNLGIDVGVQNLERKLFMDRLNKHELPLVLIPWEYDYFDASNFMNIYRTGGRHPWSNAEYDRLVNEANSTMSEAQRCATYRKAEDVLVRDPGAAFLWHPTVIQLWKPWVKGEIQRRNKFGIVGWQRPSKADMLPYIYIGREKK